MYGYPCISSAVGHLSRFHLLTILHNAARNINVQVLGICFSEYTYSSPVANRSHCPSSCSCQESGKSQKQALKEFASEEASREQPLWVLLLSSRERPGRGLLLAHSGGFSVALTLLWRKRKTVIAVCRWIDVGLNFKEPASVKSPSCTIKMLKWLGLLHQLLPREYSALLSSIQCVSPSSSCIFEERTHESPNRRTDR